MIGPLSGREADRLHVLPEIQRARDFRLYGRDGTRWLDCWLDDGRALLGHRPEGLSLRLKNEIAKGVYSPYPSVWENRLGRALREFRPGFPVWRVFRSPISAMEALGLTSDPVDPLDLPVEPRTSGASQSPDAPRSPADGVFWGRPYLETVPETRFQFLRLPLPGLTDAQVVVMRDAESGLPPSDPVSPVILSALTRIVDDTIKAEESARLNPGLWDLPISADIWDRRGPYITFRGDEEAYGALFDVFVNRNVLIAPSSRRPTVIPHILSSYERGQLTRGAG